MTSASTPDAAPQPGADESARKRKAKLGLVLFILGIVVIVAGVEYVLLQVDGHLQYEFAERTTYREAKTVVHRAYPIGFMIALLGLTISIVGGRLRSKALGRGPDD